MTSHVGQLDLGVTQVAQDLPLVEWMEVDLLFEMSRFVSFITIINTILACLSFTCSSMDVDACGE
jgi:hypothetical protein